MDIIAQIIIIGIIIGVIFLSFRKHKSITKLDNPDDKKTDLQRLINETTAYVERINKEKNIPTVSTTLFLKPGEKAYLSEHTDLYETRAVRITDRGGSAVRIMKGVYVGGSRSFSKSHDEMTKIDNGTLTLTQKRLVFDGSIANRIINIDKIISVASSLDFMEVSIEGKSKSQVYTGMQNPLLWKALINILGQIPENGEIPNINFKIQT